MEAKHTATPWRIGKSCGSVVSDAPVPEMGGSDAVAYYGGYLIAESITPYNAAFIVSACNNHEALVDACKAVDADIELIGKVSAASVDMVRSAIAQVHKRHFPAVYCSQCGGDFGPGDSGFSHCRDHQHLRARN